MTTVSWNTLDRPCDIRFGTEALKGRVTDQMTLKIDGVVDPGLDGEEMLSGGLGFEPLLLSLLPTDRQLEILRPVVASQPTGR